MRKNFGAKPYTYPQPVFIIATYGPDGTPDAMNAAWGGISGTAELSMCLSAGHKTTQNILARKAFTVSMADAAHMAECDYVGVVSANDVPDKLARAGFHTTKSEFVDAPLIDELAMAGELRPPERAPGGGDRQRQRGRKRPHPGREGGRGKAGPHRLRPRQQRLPQAGGEGG